MATKRKNENKPQRLAKGLSKAWLLRAHERRGKGSVCTRVGIDSGRTVADECELPQGTRASWRGTLLPRIGTAQSKTQKHGKGSPLENPSFKRGIGERQNAMSLPAQRGSLPFVNRKSEIVNGSWLPDMDLNHDKVIQSHLCYRYTIGQTGGGEKIEISHAESRR